MNIVINVVATGESGTLSVAISFAEKITKYYPEHNFFFLTTLNLAGRIKNISNLEIISIPSALAKRIVRPFADNIFFPKILKKINADLVLNFDNLALKTNIKQIHLAENPYMNKSCNDFIFLSALEKKIVCFRKFLFYKRSKFVDKFIFQTEAMANAFPDKIKEKGFVIIPNFHEDKDPKGIHFKKEEGYKYLLYVSYFYPHKNFDIFLPLAALIKKEKLKVKFLVSFQGAGGVKLYDNFKRLGLDDIVINLGNLSAGNIKYLYNQVDAIFFPSYLESFSRILADAYYHNLPLIVADADYSRGLFGDFAYYFDPNDHYDAYISIREFVENGGEVFTSKYYLLKDKFLSNDEIEGLWKDFLDEEIRRIEKK